MTHAQPYRYFPLYLVKRSSYLYNPRNFGLRTNNIYMVENGSLQNSIKTDPQLGVRVCLAPLRIFVCLVSQFRAIQ